jgi:hypothetical protein
MLAIMESGQHWIGPLMQDMALYFTSFRLDGTGSDLYSSLMKAMSGTSFSETLFSSLNYECLLEIAASALGLTVHYGDIPPPPDSMTVWKLHGSCNFIPDPKSISLRRGGSFGFGATFNPNLLPVSPHEAAQWVCGDTALYPAMCMFAVGKPSQISPHVFAGYQSKWAELINRAKKVFVIGVRPHLIDSHVWGPLGNTDAELFFVGSLNEYTGWLPDRRARPTNYVGPTFREALDVLSRELR